MARTYTVMGVVGSAQTISVDKEFSNWTAAATYYSDQYITEVTPSAGTLTVTGRIDGAGDDSDFTNGSIDSTSLGDYASAAGPIKTVTVTPAGIVGATHYKLKITGTK